MPCPGFETELYDLYSLGALEREEAARIEDHLRAGCSTCMEHVRNGLERAALLALSVPAAVAPGRLRRRIIASVAPARTGIREFLRSPGFAWAMAAACLVLGSSLTWYPGVPAIRVNQARGPVTVVEVPTGGTKLPVSPAPDARDARPPEPTRSVNDAQSRATALAAVVAQDQMRVSQLEADLRAKDAQLASQQREMQVLQARAQTEPPKTVAVNDSQLQEAQRKLAATEQQVEALTRQVRFYQTAIQSQRGEIERSTQLVSLLSAPTLRLLDLRATEQGGAASGRALLARNAQILFYASNLPALPAGRTYQLWLMRRRGPAVASAGIFQPDSGQRAALTVVNASDIDAITALAVTEEPAGGQPLPTGHKILIGTFKS